MYFKDVPNMNLCVGISVVSKDINEMEVKTEQNQQRWSQH